MCVKVGVVLIHEAGGRVSVLSATDIRVGWGQGEQLHVVREGVALVLVLTNNRTDNQ
jgi:hypothetical protein